MKNSTLRDIRPIGITPNRVTTLDIESKEPAPGTVKYEKAKTPRPGRNQGKSLWRVH